MPLLLLLVVVDGVRGRIFAVVRAAKDHPDGAATFAACGKQAGQYDVLLIAEPRSYVHAEEVDSRERAQHTSGR